jgi:hypothetical protein
MYIKQQQRLVRSLQEPTHSGILFDVLRYNYMMFIVHMALTVTVKNHVPEYKFGSSVPADLG